MPLNYDLDKAQQDIAELQAQNSVPQEEDKGILDTIWDNVTSGAELVVDTLDDGLQALRAYNAAAGGHGDISLEQAEDNLKMSLVNRPMNAFVNKFADSDTPLLSSFADSIQSSELAYTQIIPDEKKWEQARKIQQEIGIPAETVMYDQTAWKNANNLYDEYQKAKEFYGPDMSQEDIKQINPIIQKVSTADPAAGALIMADAYNTNKELSIIDTFNEYMEMGQMKLELDELGEKYREQKHSFEDLYRIQELQDKINHFNNKHNINFVDNPLAYAVAGLGGSWPEMSQSIRAAAEDEAAWMVAGISAGGMAGSVVPVAGTATGATVGAVGGLAVGALRNLPRLSRVGKTILGLSKNTVARDMIGKAILKATPGMFTGAQIGAFRGMAEPEVGGRYLEYRDMKDKNGNPLMDHEEASERAVIAGSANAALEIFPTFSVFGKMTKGSKAQSAAIDEVFRAAGNRYFQKSVATTAAAEFTKNTFKGAFTESGEEMLQNISDDLMLNDIEATHNDKANGGVKSYTDVILDGMGAFAASFPTSLLFGASGATGAGVFSSSKYAARRRNISRQEKMFGAELENTAIGNALAIDLQEAIHDSKLKQSAPDVQKQIIHEKAAGTGFENVYIDVEMALEKENGKEDLRAVAKAANISDEELDIAIEEKGTLAVPLECFAQSESSQDLLESASYNAETKSIARMKKEAKSVTESIKKAYNENLAQQERIINTIITELFPADENDKVSVARQDMAKSIIMTFSENPAMGWREMMKLVQDERMEIIGGALKYLEDTSGNGVSVIPTEDGKGFRASNNAEWYRKWSKGNNYRTMTKQEKEDMAEDMMRGKVSIGDYHNIPEEELQATNTALDEINGKIKALEEIKDKMLGLTGVEMKLTEGLSKEAYAGYRQIMDQLKHAPAKAVRAARMNAILLARHADLYAKIMQKKGNTDYTAKDYMDSVGLRFGGQNLGGFSQLGAEVEKQKAAIRKKYEGTNQWMKAPNGKKTNLTEEQWLAVRTPAFKEWFGDWETIANAYPTINAKERNDVSDIIANLRSKVLKSIAENIEATFNHRSIGKLTSSAAVAKSQRNGFSAADHFTAVANIEKLFESSVKTNEREDDNHDIEAVEHFSSLFIVNKKPALVTFTVKVTNNAGRKIYSIELMEMKKAEGKVLGTVSKLHKPKHPQATSALDTLNVSRIADIVNNTSKIVDENGEPLVVYHGTKRGMFADRFNTFEGNGKPIWHSSSEEYAKLYFSEKKWNERGDIYTDFLNIKNPVDVGNVEFGGTGSVKWLAEKLGVPFNEVAEIFGVEEKDETKASLPYLYLYEAVNSPEFIKWAQNKGYDGIIEVESGNNTYGVFNPNQIKSAVANNGNYDINDPNIYHQMAGERAKTAALDKLEQAKAMEKEGKLSDDIYKETGWLKGKDGKWRFEIPDNFDDIHAEEYIKEGPATKWPLGRLYENNALYEAYPSLWNIPVLLSTGMPEDTNGATVFNHVGEVIKINYRNGEIEPEQLKKTLLHEIQHIIQRKEGFASGGSIEAVINQINNTVADLESQLLEGITDEWSDDIAVVKKAKELVKNHNDIELKLLIGEQKEVNKTLKKLTEIKAQIEELLPGKKAKDVFNIVSKIRKLEVLQEKYQAASPEEKEKLALNYYSRLAGEQEANMVAYRAKLLNNEKNEVLNAGKEAGQLSLKFEREFNKVPEDIKELAGEYMSLLSERNDVVDNQEALEEKLNEMEDIEKKLNETEEGASLLSAIHDYDWAHLEELEYWNRLKEDSESMPEPHKNNAIVVFGGAGYSIGNKNTPETFYQSAWHGSPYDFDEFDLGAIGNGEGSQAHGWGLYFAADRRISEDYKNRLSSGITINGDSFIAIMHPFKQVVLKNGIELPENKSLITLIDTLQKEGSYEKALEKLGKDSNSRLKGKAIRAKGALEILKKYSPEEISFGGKLYEVEIPDTNVMLDEQKILSEQSPKVRKGIEKLIKELQPQYSYKKVGEEYVVYRGKEEIDRYDSSDEDLAIQSVEENNEAVESLIRHAFGIDSIDQLSSIAGGKIYRGLSYLIPRRYSDKDVSLKLNEYGIKGITYEGGRDGRCYVVFDDKAISIIEKFNQGIKGSLTPMADGQRIITLFESADESTFLHEMGHLFLLDLENLAKVDEQSAKELATVTEWAKFRKSDVKGYKGSPFESEFLKLAADIEAAEKAGDVATAEKLKRRWMHERFARGFEMYLEFGEAPSKGLKAVFRKFKQFLKVLYFGFAGQGVRATPEVERIMARMIASDNEIEAMALDSRYKDITKAGGEKLLEETEAQTMQRWHEEAKEEAKEKLIAIIMKDLSEEKKRERQAKIDKEREEVTTFMTSMPVYIAQKVIAETGSKDAVVEMGIYSNIEQLESDLEAVKDIPLDKAIEDHMADYEADLDKKQMDEEMTEEKLSKIMNQTYYHNKLLALETAALQERTRTMQRINSKAKNAIHEANVAIDGLDDDVEIKLDKNSPKVKAVLRALAKLRYADRWSTEDLQAIDKIINSSTKSEIAEALKEFETNSGQWKKNLKILQEAFDGQHRIIENAAKNDLAKKKLIDACAYRHYVSMEKNASNLMNMFIRQGKWEAALRQQQFRLQAAAMAKYAKKNQEKLKKLTDKVTKQLSARTVKVAKDERYWHRHLAYLLGLNKEAPVKPDELLSAAELFEGLNASLDIKDDEFKQQLYTIYEKISAQDFGGYMTLTMAELEDAVDMLTVLYTTGRDKFRMKSFDGKMLHEVVDEICQDETGIGVMTQNRYINPDTGGLGYNDILAKIPFIGENLSHVGQKYINAHIKPEELLKLVGEKAHKYIYGLYERAANEEGKMTADSVQKLKDILSVYSHAEKREWKKQKYTLVTGAGTEKVSKENIICMALNRGNETNWHRLFRGLRVDPAELANFIDENMTEKDWDTVQAIWDHIGSYWEQTVKVEEKLNGVTLKNVEPKEFIVRLPDGQQKTIRGGYYPIAYNPEKSLRAEEQSVDKAAQRTMKGAQVLGAGRGFTKGRSESLNIERPLRLSFDVIPDHLGNVIHNITYRIAARDVYRLVTSQKFEYLIRDTLGAEAYRSITDWAVDCWKIMPNNTSQAEGGINKLFGYLRRNATFNIMGYRMWPVIENSTNIFPMMDRLGVVNTLSAIGDYYAHKKECDLMMLKSSFMTNRINSMDRDIKTMPGLFDEDMKGLGWMKQHAYSMMVYSDLMLSAPLWARAYKDSIAGHYVDVERENKEMVDALRAAQAKVDDLNAQMFDLKKEKQHILEQLHPGYEVEYSPQRMRAVGYLNSELARIKSQLEPMEKALWEAEKELDKLANVDLMLPDDILKEAEVRAIQTADGAVRNVFGSGHTKDLAPIQKGGEFAKMFTCFYSFFNTQANAILANYYKGKFAKEELTGLQNIAVWMPFAKSVLFRIFLTSALSTIMKMAFGLDGDDDKDKYRKVMNEDGTETKVEIPSLERFLTQYAKNTISTASGTMVGVRDVASLICTYLFDGYDMGGSKAGSVPTAAIDKAYKTFVLMSKQDERNAKIAADKERRKARYEKMSPKQKKKFDEELQYRHPDKPITDVDIVKGVVNTGTALFAARTGITDTMVNTVMTTMQYMADGDGRYDPSLSNIMWSAFWNKNPVEREIPEKPVKPKKNKKGA